MSNKIIVEYVNIDKIKKYKNNAKLHGEEQIRQIAASIKRFGFNNPIIADQNFEIIAGHGRLEAAKIAGLTVVPVIKLSHLSEAQKRAYRLADNKIAENGGWSEELLRLELSELESICDDFDLTITGFSDVEIDVLLDDETNTLPDQKLNAVPYINEKEIISKLEDIWLLDNHRIICGNSLEEETFQKLMQGKKADMCLQDAPFNVKIQGHVGGSGSIKHREFIMGAGEMSDDEFINFLTTNFKLCAKYSKNGSIQANFMDWRHMEHILAAGKKAFTSLINLCVWNKGVGGMGSLWRSQHELCFIHKNGKESHINNVQLGSNGRYRTNVWTYPGANSFGKNKHNLKLHPTSKSVEMLKDAILDVTNRGDLILDCFLGSGSTLLAAEKSKRVCYGIELAPLYVDTVIRRYHELTGVWAVNEQSGKTYDVLLAEKLGGSNE